MYNLPGHISQIETMCTSYQESTRKQGTPRHVQAAKAALQVQNSTSTVQLEMGIVLYMNTNFENECNFRDKGWTNNFQRIQKTKFCYKQTIKKNEFLNYL